jgi:hypothetical protein
MESEELMRLEQALWKFKSERQLKCSKKEKEALITTIVLIIEEIQKTKNIKNR